ncbi:YbhB/YbcL family Raf kinase inhibitor-like protein [Mycoplasma corogypsi]|uniref:YbhB/YbcL family Raf kinase inhibitor-like protein n=1 Tax=Mycoplasma corogypsi TaxID=2106 RepID=UPI003872C2FF
MHKLGNNANIWSSAIDHKGYLHDHHGGHANVNQTPFPSYSFDLEWKPIEDAKSYAIVVEDFDAAKVIGFPFIHWVVANVKGTKLETNASYLSHQEWEKSGLKTYSDSMLWQGYNSSVPTTLMSFNKDENSDLKGVLPMGFTSQTNESAALYFGSYPPDQDHLYTLVVYGLDVDASELSYQLHGETHSLNQPYYVGDLMQALDNHVVGMHVLNYKYRQVK